MASTFSNLGLNLQATGENSGTWGAITNVNLQTHQHLVQLLQIHQVKLKHQVKHQLQPLS